MLSRAEVVEVTAQGLPGNDVGEREVLDHQGRLSGEVDEELLLGQRERIGSVHAERTQELTVTANRAHVHRRRGLSSG